MQPLAPRPPLPEDGHAPATSWVRLRGVDRWLLPYLYQTPRRWSSRRGKPIHVLLCIADHFEPKLGRAPREVADRRVETWVREYPRLFGSFRDRDGRPPRHSFFFPQEEYEPEHVDAL